MQDKDYYAINDLYKLNTTYTIQAIQLNNTNDYLPILQTPSAETKQLRAAKSLKMVNQTCKPVFKQQQITHRWDRTYI